MIREGKIFVAGDYPDKNLTIKENDLKEYIKNFTPCPVKIEHSDTAFDGVLGTLKSIYQKGSELFGKIDFIDEAWSLMEKAGAKSLSIAINPIKKTIEEVSIVKHPRIADARVFSMNINDIFSQELFSENARLLKELSDIKATIKAEKYLNLGKITPAAFDSAKKLFKITENETFCNKNLFEDFLNSLPECVDFSQIERQYRKENEYSEEEIEFAKKLGVNLGGE